jgi:hypothetical protein
MPGDELATNNTDLARQVKELTTQNTTLTEASATARAEAAAARQTATATATATAAEQTRLAEQARAEAARSAAAESEARTSAAAVSQVPIELGAFLFDRVDPARDLDRVGSGVEGYWLSLRSQADSFLVSSALASNSVSGACEARAAVVSSTRSGPNQEVARLWP